MILEVVLLSFCSAVFGGPLRGLSLELSPPLPDAKSFFQEPLVGRIVEFTRHLPKFNLPKFHDNAFEDQEHTMRRHKPHEIPYFAMKQEPREEYIISSKPVVTNKVYQDEEVIIKLEDSYSFANDETTETYSTTTEDIETTTFDEDEDLLNRMGVPPAVVASLLG